MVTLHRQTTYEHRVTQTGLITQRYKILYNYRYQILFQFRVTRLGKVKHGFEPLVRQRHEG